MVRLSRRHFTAGVGAALLAGPAGSAATSAGTEASVPESVHVSWPAHRHDARNTGRAGGGVDVSTPLSEAWSVRGDFVGAVVGGGSVFLPTADGTVRAVDPVSGRTRWRTSLENRVAARPALGPERLFVPTLGGRLAAVHVGERSVEWTLDRGEPIDAAPTVAGDAVYVSTLDGTVLAVSRESGEVRWEVSLDGAVRTTPAVVDGTVYVATGSTVFAVRDGTVEWDLPQDADVETSPVVHGDRLLVGLAGGTLVAFDRSDATTLWSATTTGALAGPPAVTDQAVFATTTDGWVHAFWSDGEPIWAKTHGNEFAAPPVGAGGFLWVVTTGERLARVGTGAGSASYSKDRVGGATGLLAGRGMVVVEGEESVAGLFNPAALDARRALRGLASNVSSAGSDIELSEARDFMSRSAAAYRANQFRRAADLAESGLDRIDAQRKQRREAEETIEELSRRIDRSRREATPPESCDSDGWLFGGLPLDGPAGLLDDAREEYDAGNYDTANQTASSGITILEATKERAARAREEIDALGNRLSAPGAAQSDRAEQSLSAACTAYADGDYRKARSTAEEGRSRLEAAEERAAEASTAMQQLREDVAAAEGDDLHVPRAREQLSLAEDRYAAGNYTGATAAAADGRAAVEETRTEARRARELMDRVERANHPEPLEGFANLVGRDDLLARAEAAYDEGRYEDAVSLAGRASRRESVVTGSFGVATFLGVGAYLEHRRRGGTPLVDLVVDRFHEE